MLWLHSILWPVNTPVSCWPDCTPQRRGRLERALYHNVATAAEMFDSIFGIDILDGLSADERAFGTLRFHRRHVYEHNGGEADERYIANSGDSVRLKQALRETQESAHRTTSFVLSLARNLHAGFHEMFPPRQGPIRKHREEIERREKREKRQHT